MQHVSGKAIETLLDITHRLAHAEGGCDERPLLIASLAWKQLENVIEFLDDEDVSKAVTDFSALISFTSASFVEQFTESIKEKLPKEMQEAIAKQRPTVH